MTIRWVITTIVGLFLLAFSASAFAWSGRADINGKPEDLRPGGVPGYYIWQDDSGFHVWTTSRGREHAFSGVIRTDGRIVHVRGHRLEAGDSFRVYSDIQENVWFRSSDRNDGRQFVLGGRQISFENDQLRFKFETEGGSDGINFRIVNASFVEFDLYEDGRPVHRRQVFIGDEGWHPRGHKFRFEQ